MLDLLVERTHINVHHFYGFNYKDPVADDKSCRKLQNKVQNNSVGSLDAHSGKHEFLFECRCRIAKIIRKLQAESTIISLTKSRLSIHVIGTSLKRSRDRTRISLSVLLPSFSF